MITVRVHARGAVVDQDLPIDQISDVLQADDTLVWVDVTGATTEDLAVIEQEFGFHHLAIEDAVLVHERPKVDLYDGVALIIFYAITNGAEDSGIDLQQISIFAGANFLVTLHRDELIVIDETSARWRANHARIAGHATALLVYSLLDSLVDDYVPVIDTLYDRIAQIEDAIFGRFDPTAQKEIFRLRRDLLLIRRILTPERDVLNVLMQRDTPIYSPETIRYFQDVYDHLLRVLDSIDTYRELLSTALESYLTVLSNRTNKVMKTLTASSIILMGMTLVASTYGMNFEHMPELAWLLGYPWALGLMATIGISLGVLFKKIDWL